METSLRQWGAKWGRILGAPAELIDTITSIESSFYPQTQNMTERAVPLGGAWGPMQVTLTTAKGIAAALAKNPNAEVQETLARWTGQGPDLYDPALGMLFGVSYLAKLWKKFQDFTLAAAAYQQGPGKITKMLAAGQAIPEELPPHGKQYVAMATAARDRLFG